jgi:RHS repeat-associated protein
LLADEQVESLTSAGETLWALTDHLGSVRDVVDNNGTLRVHRDYLGFGTIDTEIHYNASGTPVTSGSGYVDVAFRYTGRWLDDETGLQNNLNRWYDASTGQWISEDPIGFAASDANLNRYVGNEPTGYIDPSGLVISGTESRIPPFNDQSGQSGQNERPWWAFLKDFIWGSDFKKELEDLRHTQAGDYPRRGDRNTFDAFEEAGDEAGQLLKDAAKEAGTELAGLKAFALISKLDDANDVRKAAKARRLIERHHLLPRQFAPRFKQVGLNIDDYVIDLSRARHRLKPNGIHTGPDHWNKQWQRFFDYYDSRSKAPKARDILNHLETMKRQFGLQ